jgi:hypothetical protein
MAVSISSRADFSRIDGLGNHPAKGSRRKAPKLSTSIHFAMH